LSWVFPPETILALPASAMYPPMRSYALRSITAPMKLRKSATSPILIVFMIATVRSRTSFQIERGT
jgi:hypothetical protein